MTESFSPQTATKPAGDRQIPREGAGVRQTFSSLRHRDYRLLWIGQLGHSAAMWMEQVARGWLVWELTHSALDLGLVQFFRAIPFLLSPLLAGLTVDRFDRRRILLLAQAVDLAMKVGLALLISTHLIQMWHLYLTSFIIGSSMSFNQPTRQALITHLVGPKDLTNAVALNTMAMNMTRILGPALAGVLVGTLGVGGVYWLMAVVYSVVMLTTFLMRVPKMPARSKESVWQNLGGGFRYVGQHRPILGVLILGLGPIVLGWPYFTLLPIFADEIFRIGAVGLGLLSAASGVGALAGSLVIASRGEIRAKGWLLSLGVFGFGAFLILFALSPFLPLALVGLLGLGVAQAIYMTMSNTLLLDLTPTELHGRVMSLYMLDRGLSPLGQMLASALAEGIGAPLALGIMGAGCGLLALTMGAVQPALRRL